MGRKWLKGDAGRWPDDEEFKRNWMTVSTYYRVAQARMRMVLEALDLQMVTKKQEMVHISGDLSIEHIFPQTPVPGEWPEVPEHAILNSIGNSSFG